MDKGDFWTFVLVFRKCRRFVYRCSPHFQGCLLCHEYRSPKDVVYNGTQNVCIFVNTGMGSVWNCRLYNITKSFYWEKNFRWQIKGLDANKIVLLQILAAQNVVPRARDNFQITLQYTLCYSFLQYFRKIFQVPVFSHRSQICGIYRRPHIAK